jgi:nucleoporin SEH1
MRFGPKVHQARFKFPAATPYTIRFLSPRIKIWKLGENSGSWSIQDEWKVSLHPAYTKSSSDLPATIFDLDLHCIQAHEAPVSKVGWAHPEFGSVIASCSFDRTAKVWEQAPSSALLDSQLGASTAGSGPGGAAQHQPITRWIERNVMAESKGTVRDVAFAPHYFGLKLVCFYLVLSVMMIRVNRWCNRQQSHQIISSESTNA